MFWIRSNDLSSFLTLFFFKCQSIYESRCTFEFLHIRLTLQNHPRTLSHKTRSRQTHNKEVEVESRIVIGIPFYSQTTQQRVERRIATRSVSGVKEGARNQVQVWRNFFQSVCWNRQATGWQPVGFSPVFLLSFWPGHQSFVRVNRSRASFSCIWPVERQGRDTYVTHRQGKLCRRPRSSAKRSGCSLSVAKNCLPLLEMARQVEPPRCLFWKFTDAGVNNRVYATGVARCNGLVPSLLPRSLMMDNLNLCFFVYTKYLLL